MRYLAPSLLSADFCLLSEQIDKITRGGADIIHCDVMDGHFVPNLTFGPPVIQSIRKHTKLPLDAHLMINQPDLLIPAFIQAGADYITVHQEAVPHLHRTIQLISSQGVKAGVAINPATPVSLLDDILEYVDLILIMSVNPGFGGQSFIPSTLKKARYLVEARAKYNLNFKIEIDGGVNLQTVQDIKSAGVDIFVAGSAVFNADDIVGTTAMYKKLLND